MKIYDSLCILYTSIDDCNETEISKIETKNYLRERIEEIIFRCIVK